MTTTTNGTTNKGKGKGKGKGNGTTTTKRKAGLTRGEIIRAAATRDEIQALLDRRSLAAALTGPADRGEIDERPVHNDAKIANVLFDATSGDALCVVDLDTTMPGFAPHDFGDLVRSAVSDSASPTSAVGVTGSPRPTAS